MKSEIYENEFSSGIIEYNGRPICKIRNIQVTKVELEPKGIKHIFMKKEYQNNRQEEHDEIDTDLINIFENNEIFTVLCYNDNVSMSYSCIFAEKPQKGDNYVLSVEVIN